MRASSFHQLRNDSHINDSMQAEAGVLRVPRDAILPDPGSARCRYTRVILLSSTWPSDRRGRASAFHIHEDGAGSTRPGGFAVLGNLKGAEILIPLLVLGSTVISCHTSKMFCTKRWPFGGSCRR